MGCWEPHLSHGSTLFDDIQVSRISPTTDHDQNNSTCSCTNYNAPARLKIFVQKPSKQYNLFLRYRKTTLISGLVFDTSEKSLQNEASETEAALHYYRGGKAFGWLHAPFSLPYGLFFLIPCPERRFKLQQYKAHSHSSRKVLYHGLTSHNSAHIFYFLLLHTRGRCFSPP